MASKTPQLNLNPETSQVLSRDFNLFFKPEPEPVANGVKEFAQSLQSFSDGAVAKNVITSEIKKRKVMEAQAIQDRAENKIKFRDAVKSGKINEATNPYFAEKFKELTLKDFATKFNDTLLKGYANNNVENNVTEGAFDKFYSDTLKDFIKKNGLGQFQALELENGFFKDTSSYRNSLEAQHRQKQLELFKKKFKKKVKDRVVGVIEKYKNIEALPVEKGKPAPDKFELIAKELQKEIGSLIQLNGNGRNTVDTIFEGLKEYVGSTDDTDFAKEVINEVSKDLIAGTDSIAKIGRIKNQIQELNDELNEKQSERLTRANNFDKSKKENETVNTYNQIQKMVDADPDFNVTEWKKDKSEAQKLGAERYLDDQRFQGNGGNNPEVEVTLDILIQNRQFEEASRYASTAFREGQLTKGKKDSYLTTIIPNALANKDSVYFNLPPIKSLMSALDSTIKSGTKDRILASQARSYLSEKMNSWLQSPEAKSLEGYAKTDAFEKKFNENLNNLKQISQFNNALFGQGTPNIGSDTNVNNLDAQIKKQKEKKIIDTKAQKKIDELLKKKKEQKKKNTRGQ